MKMRERIRRAALLFAGMLLLGGCGRMAEIPDPDRLQVVCTTYPQYSYLQAIIGEVSDSVELTLIMDDEPIFTAISRLLWIWCGSRPQIFWSILAESRIPGWRMQQRKL